MLDYILEFISGLNQMVNRFVWGPQMLVLFLFTGLMFTIRTGFFQLRHFRLWLSRTIGSCFGKNRPASDDKHSISPFQSLCTALAGTMGTGNIAGVATAITAGGPGAVFWMWVSALLGMMTHYAEVVLGMKYRYKNAKGEWMGGAFVYIERGLHRRWLACLFAFFCIVASLGMGNMAQSNSLSTALYDSFHVPPLVSGSVFAVLVGIVIIGGIKRISGITEKIIPAISILYILGALLVIAVHIGNVPGVFHAIIREAFTVKAAGSGAIGYGIATAMRKGISRGVFSNEAGLGSSVVVHSASRETEPVVQGMWGIFEVFADTIVMCTITAVAIMASGVYNQGAYTLALSMDQAAGGSAHFDALLNGVPLTSAAFSTVFGRFGSTFVSVSITLFAFSTLIGWSYYGERSTAYLFGSKFVPHYKLVFVYFVFLGALLNLNFVWDISDTFNGLMALPNLLAVILLSGKVVKETKRFMKK